MHLFPVRSVSDRVTQGSVTATLEIAAGQGAEGGWRVSAKVGNRMNCQLREEGGRLKAGPVISTRMMPPPELRELENNVSDILGNLTDIQRNG